MIELYHGSNERIETIRDGGMFGGLFASPDRSAARAHGDVVHVIEIDESEVARDFALNYGERALEAWAIAVEIAGSEDRAERALNAACPDGGDGEEGWELQRIRGEIAARMGFKAIEMIDEHGKTYLCLPGCKIVAE